MEGDGSKSNTPAEVVWGARTIGRVIGKTERSTFHLISKGVLPVKRVGGQLCALRSELLKALSSSEAA
jgi:hypothetical protein